MFSNYGLMRIWCLRLYIHCRIAYGLEALRSHEVFFFPSSRKSELVPFSTGVHVVTKETITCKT